MMPAANYASDYGGDDYDEQNWEANLDPVARTLLYGHGSDIS